MLTCRDAEQFVVDYLDGVLPEEQRRVFDAHLQECPACVQWLDNYRDTIRRSRDAMGARDASLPDALIRSILDALRRPFP